MHPWRFLISAALACMAAAAGVRAETTVVYPRLQPDIKGVVNTYPLDVLQAALANAPRRYRVVPSKVSMNQARALAGLGTPGGVDLIWTVSSVEREQKALPVRIPIDRGLMGWRLLLIKRSDLDRFVRVQHADELAKMMAVQGHDWPDTEVLQRNGFKVRAVSGRESLHATLATARIDYFPRAVNEALREAESYKDDGFVVEPHLLLHYPAALYFFVAPHNRVLADDIRAGLEAMVADGRLEKMFQAEYGAVIREARLKARTVIQLPNPLLPPETPLQDHSLWFIPWTDTARANSPVAPRN